MKNRTVLIIWFLLIASYLPMMKIEQATQKEPAKFVIASWSFPADNYGQGIDKIVVYENNTGSWIPIETLEYDEDSTCEIETASGVIGTIRINVWAWQNSTLTGAINWEDGKNYHRHSIAINNWNETLIFSQQNFTYASCSPAIDPPRWYYEYEVLLIDFVPIDGEIYTATLGYDVYQPYMTNTTAHVADSGTGDYADSLSIDSNYWTVFAVTSTDPEYAYFIHPETTLNVSGFDYAFYGHSSTSGLLRCYNGSDLNDLEYVTSGSDIWYNGTHLGDILEGDNVTLAIHASSVPMALDCDYLEINWIYSDWINVHTVNFYLIAPFDMWGINTGIILLGLIMIPASTMYLIIGAKHDRSSDRLYYGLVVFFIGWALVIGGILP